MELDAIAVAAGRDGVERTWSGAWPVSNTHTKNVLVGRPRLGNSFPVTCLFLQQRFPPELRPILLLEFMSRHVRQVNGVYLCASICMSSLLFSWRKEKGVLSKGALKEIWEKWREPYGSHPMTGLKLYGKGGSGRKGRISFRRDSVPWYLAIQTL